MTESTSSPPSPFVRTLLAGALATSSVVVAGCHHDYEEAVTTWHRNATSLTHALPTTDTERAALERAVTVPASRSVVVLGDDTVTFGDVYSSAAGRDCRTLAVQPVGSDLAPHERLICLEGDGWVLVPDLLESGTRDGPEDEL